MDNLTMVSLPNGDYFWAQRIHTEPNKMSCLDQDFMVHFFQEGEFSLGENIGLGAEITHLDIV